VKRFIFSLLFGGGAFASLMLISAEIGMLRGADALGSFLVFYSAVYVLGQVVSLGGYQRGPYWVVQNLDTGGRFRPRRKVEAVLGSAIALGAGLIWVGGETGLATLAAASLLVGVQFVISGFANGLGRFVLARINFVIAPNLLFVAALPFTGMDATRLYGLCLAGAAGLGLIALNLTGWLRALASVGPSQKIKIMDLASIMVTILVSSISQLDLWIVGAFLGSQDLARYAFASRMTIVLTFPVIAYISAIQPTLADLVAGQDHPGVRRIFGPSYRVPRLMVIVLGLIAPMFASAWGYLVFGQFEWRVAAVAVAVSAGYALSALVPPFEALSYARGREGRYLDSVVAGLAVQVATSLALIAAGLFYLSPLIGGMVLGAIRYRMRGELDAR
jgi:O-antigen/teichoic acid export membrane protein